MTTLVPAHPKLTTDEARALTEEIRSDFIRLPQKIILAYRGEIWTALGYESFREWGTKEYGIAQTQVYQLLNYARVEEALSAIAEKPVEINEAQARSLATLETPEQQRAAFALAQETAAASGAPLTAKVVKAAVEQVTGKPSKPKRNGAEGQLERDRLAAIARAVEPPPHGPGTISDAELDDQDMGDPVSRTKLAFRECDEAQQLKAGGALIDEMKGQSFVRITLLFLSSMNPEQVFEVCARSGLSLPK